MSFVQGLPKSIEVNGAMYPIKTDYRDLIQFEQFFETDENELMQMAKAIYFLLGEEIPDNVQETWNQIMWFYSGGKEIIESSKKGSKLYDFELDNEYFYSAFLTEYRIDLYEVEYMHWWKFRSMLLGLPEDTELSKIMGYRAIKLDKKMSKEQKAFYRKMKKIYSLKKLKVDPEEQKLDEIIRNKEWDKLQELC